MSRTLISAAVILVALSLAWLYQRSRPSKVAQTQARHSHTPHHIHHHIPHHAVPSYTAPSYTVPTHLERWDFAHPNSEWLIAIFTSKTCSTCAAVTQAAQSLTSEKLTTHKLAIQEVEYRRHRKLHSRYGISAVPLAVLVNNVGTVVASLAGPTTAEELAEVINKHVHT
ncbi:MAG: hypothetical protein F4138_01965 [Acidimicrobiia bacterium]|nr:hypothetical protein [Acidimicrobiia bacterium]MYC57429.1 hypothetical protein [Acidimicrobiia bacterium]MYG93750.1 hypothetical protein [Acidimicrobiia bacterium]MYI30674.1 hypothetical protein [Acidimicrobiia bacterium]